MRKAFELFSYLSELVKERHGKTGDDLLTRIANLEDGLNDEELVGLSILPVLAGLDTVTDALRMGMQRLAENPDKRQEIVDDPSLIPKLSKNSSVSTRQHPCYHVSPAGPSASAVPTSPPTPGSRGTFRRPTVTRRTSHAQTRSTFIATRIAGT